LNYSLNIKLFDQDTSTYTYILGDPDTREAVIIDPVLQQVDRDLLLIKQLDLALKYACKLMILTFRYYSSSIFTSSKYSCTR
jgi:hypothetical protein